MHGSVLRLLTLHQRQLIDEIERRTGAKVRIDPFSAFKIAWLVSSSPKYDEDGDLIDDPDRLSYIIDSPQKNILSAEQLEKYPTFIREKFPIGENLCDSCNILPADEIGDDFTEILQDMLDRTILLQMGWHLGCEEDFDDPFDPDPQLFSILTEEEKEEEQIWQEYLNSKELEKQKDDPLFQE